MKKYFGTDGIRGVPNETLTQELISSICASVETIISPQNIAIISDTRSSSGEIMNWISLGFSENINIYNHGILPSGSMPIILKKFEPYNNRFFIFIEFQITVLQSQITQKRVDYVKKLFS